MNLAMHASHIGITSPAHHGYRPCGLAPIINHVMDHMSIFIMNTCTCILHLAKVNASNGQQHYIERPAQVIL